MSLNNFIPTIWSARLQANLHKALVYAQPGVVNRDYEGEIREKGNTVKILSFGQVSVGTYTKDTDITSPEVLQDGAQQLEITEQKYFHFSVDDVDKAQMMSSVMDTAMTEAAYALGNTVDQFLAAKYVDAATATAIGSDGTPKNVGIGTGETLAYNILVDLGVRLDEQNIPQVGRWVIVPPWFEGMLLKDERFVSFATPTSDQRLLNGMVKRAAGFDIIKSNNVPIVSSTKYKILAGHPMAITFAEQINQVEAYRPEKRFSDAVKGLMLYGAKVVRANALAVLTATKGTE